MSGTPTPAGIRAAAAQLVAQTVDGGRSLDESLAGDTDEGSARGLKRSLAYGTLRWHFRLLAILARLVDRPPGKMQPPLRALLEVGLFQLLSGETAPHAAVAETVNAARELGLGRAAGFVNAVLRRFQREREQVLAVVDANLAERTAHPRWFVETLQRERGSRTEAILDANNAHPPMWLRVNRRRATTRQCQDELVAAGWDVQLHPLATDALLVAPAADARALPGFDAGRVSVQDAAAQLAVDLLSPRTGERILDACAAPGGKTCHILERVDCRLTAVDVAPGRIARIRENLDRLGLQADLRAGDLASPDGWWDGQPYDRILLDVPCSATGVIRRHPDIKLLRRASDISALAGRQRDLLRAGWQLLAPGGTLLYASCSVLRAENDVIVDEFLKNNKNVVDITPELTAHWPLDLADAVSTGPGLQIIPGQAGMDGFYYACLVKSA